MLICNVASAQPLFSVLHGQISNGWHCAGCSDPCPDFTGVNNHQRMRIAAEMAGGAEAVMTWTGCLIRHTRCQAQQNLMRFWCGMFACQTAKRWPAENFATLARTCHEDNISVMLTGTTADRDVIEMVQSLAPDAINLCGQTSIADLARLTASAEFVVGNDTGPVFLAAATGAPTIMVMGPDTNPEMSAPTGPRCDWVRATPISNVSIDYVGGALQRLTSTPV